MALKAAIKDHHPGLASEILASDLTISETHGTSCLDGSMVVSSRTHMEQSARSIEAANCALKTLGERSNLGRPMCNYSFTP